MNHTPDTTTAADTAATSTRSRPRPCWTRPRRRRAAGSRPPRRGCWRPGRVLVLAACGGDLALGARAAPLPGPDLRGHPHPARVRRPQFQRHRRGSRAPDLAGVRGGTRLRPAEIAVLVLAWAAAAVLMWATGRRRGELRPVPHHGADRPRPGLGGHHRGPGQLAQLRHRARGRRHRRRGRARRTSRSVGGRRRGPVRRAARQRRRHRLAAARMTGCHDRRRRSTR